MQQPIPHQSPIADHMHWRVRNQSYITALGLGLIGIAAFAGGAVARSLPVKAAFFGVGAIAPIVAGARFRHDYKQSELMGAIEESAFIQGYRESQVKLFAPIDAQRQQSQQQQPIESAHVEEDPDVAVFEEILALGEPLSSILLGLIQLGVDVTADSVVKAAENDRGKGWVISVTKPSAVVRLAPDLMAVAKLPVEPILSVVSGGIAVILPNPVVEADADTAGPSIAIPVADKVAVESDAPMEVSDRLPDGARLVEMAALNNIDRYPIVILVGIPGAGKTATGNALFSALSGLKIIASPKPMSSATQAIADLIFGFNKSTKRWRYFGNYVDTDFSDGCDINHWVAQDSKVAGSMLEFLWACRSEAANRQIDTSRDRVPVRAFYDEAAQTYLTGFDDPFGDEKGKIKEKTQAVISSCLKDAFMNWRGQGVQLFIGTQNDNVGSIGLDNFAKVKDDCWFIYPAHSAITKAMDLGKMQLAGWLKRRVANGHGIAIAVKNNQIVEAINLPNLETLKRLSVDE